MGVRQILRTCRAGAQGETNQGLAPTHVLEDGGRVFGTEDGTQVFDEHGAEVGSNELDPNAIDPTIPTWEAFSEALEKEAALTAQRTEILELQERVDAARECVDRGDISEEELAELDADLLEAMPDAVLQHVPGMGT